MQAIDWTSFSPRDRAVICFARTEDEILMIRKKRGLGAGKINGPGGRIEPGETPYEAAIRETQEEVGITLVDPKPHAELWFAFADGYTLFATVFVAYHHHGPLIETDEADPFWVSIANIPYEQMWQDDKLWLPEVLAGRPVIGKFFFDGDRMLEHRVEPCPDLQTAPQRSERSD